MNQTIGYITRIIDEYNKRIKNTDLDMPVTLDDLKEQKEMFEDVLRVAMDQQKTELYPIHLLTKDNEELRTKYLVLQETNNVIQSQRDFAEDEQAELKFENISLKKQIAELENENNKLCMENNTMAFELSSWKNKYTNKFKESKGELKK